MNDEQKVIIDDKEYAVNDMSDAAKEQLNNVRVVDQELQRLRMKIAIAQTAKSAYAQALKDALYDNG
ncbi:DUF6447 family protein [Thalassobaculum litoreum]|uniref:DUF6447 family protein n=1 Tax=Thalassobaculum litoreum TaxID=420996 RepID=UPI001C07B538|nr:DUF6447 family protein [Thalassobaculum litoreum]